MLDPLFLSILVNLGQFALITLLINQIGTISTRLEQSRNEAYQLRNQSMNGNGRANTSVGALLALVVIGLCIGAFFLIPR